MNRCRRSRDVASIWRVVVSFAKPTRALCDPGGVAHTLLLKECDPGGLVGS